MGVLVAKVYPAVIIGKVADHTYVECGSGKKGWGCWGGKEAGTELRRGIGSTKRADAIAGRDEKANIKCYAINGVCHQAANRILLAAGITVRGARGYSISEALFGTYGRVRGWPCKSPLNQYPNVSGDFPECAVEMRKGKKQVVALTSDNKLDWHYIRGVLAIYDQAPTIATPTSKSALRAYRPREAVLAASNEFHLRLFQYQAEFHLGPLMDRPLKKRILAVRKSAENKRLGLEISVATGEMTLPEYAVEFNKITVEFQNEMASVMSPEAYRTLFELEPGDTVTLVDPAILGTEAKE